MSVFDRLAAIVLVFVAVGPATAVEVAPPGASACSGCHPVGRMADSPFTRLVGRNAGDIAVAMQEFRSGARPATVMDRIAKGFTDAEIKAIAAWFAAQKE